MTVDPRWEENTRVAQAAAGSADELIPALARIIKTGAWREFVDPMHGLQVYETFPAYCDGWVRVPAEAVEALLDSTGARKLANVVRQELRRALPPAANPGRPKKDTNKVDNINNKGGTDPDYALARLKRDRPDLAQQVIDGTLSASAAAVQAGHRHKYAQVRTDDSRKAITALLKHYTREQLRDALQEQP